MVPLSAETGGRFDGAFSNFLKEVVTSGLDFGESPVPVWTKETLALFASRLRSAHVTIRLRYILYIYRRRNTSYNYKSSLVPPLP